MRLIVAVAVTVLVVGVSGQGPDGGGNFLDSKQTAEATYMAREFVDKAKQGGGNKGPAGTAGKTSPGPAATGGAGDADMYAKVVQADAVAAGEAAVDADPAKNPLAKAHAKAEAKAKEVVSAAKNKLKEAEKTFDQRIDAIAKDPTGQASSSLHDTIDELKKTVRQASAEIKINHQSKQVDKVLAAAKTDLADAQAAAATPAAKQDAPWPVPRKGISGATGAAGATGVAAGAAGAAGATGVAAAGDTKKTGTSKARKCDPKAIRALVKNLKKSGAACKALIALASDPESKQEDIDAAKCPCFSTVPVSVASKLDCKFHNNDEETVKSQWQKCQYPEAKKAAETMSAVTSATGMVGSNSASATGPAGEPAEKLQQAKKRAVQRKNQLPEALKKALTALSKKVKKAKGAPKKDNKKRAEDLDEPVDWDAEPEGLEDPAATGPVEGNNKKNVDKGAAAATGPSSATGATGGSNGASTSSKRFPPAVVVGSPVAGLPAATGSATGGAADDGQSAEKLEAAGKQDLKSAEDDMRNKFKKFASIVKGEMAEVGAKREGGMKKLEQAKALTVKKAKIAMEAAAASAKVAEAASKEPLQERQADKNLQDAKKTMETAEKPNPAEPEKKKEEKGFFEKAWGSIKNFFSKW